MKGRFYNGTLDMSGLILNLCIRWNWWAVVNTLIQFRKNHIVKPLRNAVKNRKPK